jgi:hypothetical protein
LEEVVMKKIIQYIVLLLIIGFGFTSCGGNIAKVKKMVSSYDEGRTLETAMEANPYLRGGKYSAYKSTTGYDIVKYEKVIENSLDYKGYFPDYIRRRWDVGDKYEAVLSTNSNVHDFFMYMDLFGPGLHSGEGQTGNYKFLNLDNETVSTIQQHAAPLSDIFLWQQRKEFFNADNDILGVNFRYVGSIFAPDYETSKLFERVFDAIDDVTHPYYVDEATEIDSFLDTRYYPVAPTEELKTRLRTIYQLPRFKEKGFTEDEIATFDAVFWDILELQHHINDNTELYEAYVKQMREGDWVYEAYKDTPQYARFNKAVITFYFYIDQTTGDPVELSFTENAYFDVDVPDVYTGPVEVEFLAFDVNGYDAQEVFNTIWTQGRNFD